MQRGVAQTESKLFRLSSGFSKNKEFGSKARSNRVIVSSAARCLSSSSTSQSHLEDDQKTAFLNARKWLENFTGSKSNLSNLEWAEYHHHSHFFEEKQSQNSSENDGQNQGGMEKNPIADQLKRSFYARHVLPQTISRAKETHILDDCLGEEWQHGNTETLPVQVELQFDVVEARNWRGTYGQFIDSISTLKSPRVTLTAPPSSSRKDVLYTILLNDLDTPHLENGSYEEWCHWLITDVAINNEGVMTIPPSTTKYLANSDLSTTNVSGPGCTIFDYVPMHPALSNPKKQHRYLFTVWEQPQGKQLTDELLAAKKEWSLSANAERESKDSLPLHVRLYEGDVEKSLEYRERFVAFPTLKLAEKYGLCLKGFAHYTSGFSINTPAVFKKLGLHQPVYGPMVKPETEHSLVSKLETSSSIAKNLVKGESDSISNLKDILKDIDRDTLKRLNHGYKLENNANPLPTRRDLKYLASLSDQGKGALHSEIVKAAKEKVKKLNLTVWGAAGLARLDSQFAGGDIVKKVKEKRNKYENI